MWHHPLAIKNWKRQMVSAKYNMVQQTAKPTNEKKGLYLLAARLHQTYIRRNLIFLSPVTCHFLLHLLSGTSTSPLVAIGFPTTPTDMWDCNPNWRHVFIIRASEASKDFRCSETILPRALHNLAAAMQCSHQQHSCSKHNFAKSSGHLFWQSFFQFVGQSWFTCI